MLVLQFYFFGYLFSLSICILQLVLFTFFESRIIDTVRVAATLTLDDSVHWTRKLYAKTPQQPTNT